MAPFLCWKCRQTKHEIPARERGANGVEKVCHACEEKITARIAGSRETQRLAEGRVTQRRYRRGATRPWMFA